MTKSDLRTGMLVTFRNGKKMYVYLNASNAFDNNANILTNGYTWTDLKYYNEDLTRLDIDSDMDIVAIERPCRAVCLHSHKDMELIWERDASKKMTVAEIEKILGYKVEIISEK